MSYLYLSGLLFCGHNSIIISTDHPIIECVVNVSEGRRLSHLYAITALLHRDKSVYVLHRDIGRDANRTVFTIVGIAEEVFEAIERLLLYADQYLDIRKHEGSHPRVGIVDVVPFIPIYNISEEELIKEVRSFSERIAHNMGLPVFYYGQLSNRKSQKTLHDLRKYELAMSIGQTIFPDKGPLKPHPQLGASCVTMRAFMGAYNINLNTHDLQQAKTLAKRLRHSREYGLSDGIDLSHVKILGWYVEEYGCCQISTNVYDLGAVKLLDLYRYVSKEAEEMSLSVQGSELIGMIPISGICKTSHSLDSALKELRFDSVRPFDKEVQVLDYRLQKLSWRSS